jgi:anti-sigma factor RsiW
MINNSFAHKRHIPEEELHAYLDQALSRSQCVEIESHLAVCPPCREQRDDIAALRDRTTALLSTMAPPTIHAPPFAELRQRHLERSVRRQRLIRRSAWAASIVMALGFGWSARAFSPAGTEATPGTGELPAAPVEVATTPPSPAAALPINDPARQTDPVPADTATQTSSLAERPAAETLVANAAVPQPAPLAADRFPSSLADRPLNEKPPLQITSTNLIAQDELATDGVWRSLSWDGAMEQSVDDWVPRVDGLPVVNVQVKESNEEYAKPLMVVSQRLGTGEVIRTFSGPADEVTDLLARQPGQSITASLQILDNEDSLTTAGDSLARQQSSGAERILAIQGSISVDSLRTLLLRLR